MWRDTSIGVFVFYLMKKQDKGLFLPPHTGHTVLHLADRFFAGVVFGCGFTGLFVDAFLEMVFYGIGVEDWVHLIWPGFVPHRENPEMNFIFSNFHWSHLYLLHFHFLWMKGEKLRKRWKEFISWFSCCIPAYPTGSRKNLLPGKKHFSWCSVWKSSALRFWL